MLYRKIAWYNCEEEEDFSIDKLYDYFPTEDSLYPVGQYISDVDYKGKQCELYCEYGYDYTLYEIIEEYDHDGEMIDRRHQEYKDSKYEN